MTAHHIWLTFLVTQQRVNLMFSDGVSIQDFQNEVSFFTVLGSPSRSSHSVLVDGGKTNVLPVLRARFDAEYSLLLWEANQNKYVMCDGFEPPLQHGSLMLRRKYTDALSTSRLESGGEVVQVQSLGSCCSKSLACYI
jgi:hypothetical protein